MAIREAVKYYFADFVRKWGTPPPFLRKFPRFFRAFSQTIPGFVQKIGYGFGDQSRILADEQQLQFFTFYVWG